jgi:hypothetical protein
VRGAGDDQRQDSTQRSDWDHARDEQRAARAARRDRDPGAAGRFAPTRSSASRDAQTTRGWRRSDELCRAAWYLRTGCCLVGSLVMMMQLRTDLVLVEINARGPRIVLIGLARERVEDLVGRARHHDLICQIVVET